MSFAALLEWVGARVWHASYQAGWLILLVWVLQRLLRRKLSPRWRYALWFPVVLRLALPITPSAPFSLFRGVPSWEASSAVAVGALASKSPALVRSSADRAQVSPGPVSPRDAEAAVGGGVGAEVRQSDPDRDASRGFGEALGAVPASPHSTIPASPAVVGTTAEFANLPETAKDAGRPSGSRWPRGVLGSTVWATGTCLGLAYAVGGWIWLRARVRRYRPVTDPAVLRVWDDCRGAMGVRGTVRLVEAVDGAGPALLGPGACTLLLPAGFASRFGEDALRHVFLHELAHLRRGDLWANAAMVVLQAVHWFNPLVWFALDRVRAAREEAADALALDHAGSDEARRYGLTILRIVEEAVAARPLPGWVGILDEPKRLAERIEAIAGFRSGSGSIRWPMV
ncbi:MAG: hypothetical protein JNL97_06630, partial [Verrucomicrobiales bacterium]|nr:hypothetical protein [Verrucomicrobiales bacterium]